MSRIDNLVGESLRIFEQLMEKSERPILSYSGGKDSLVVALLIQEAGLSDYVQANVCDSSFYFTKQLEDIKQMAQDLRVTVEYPDSLDTDWLLRHPKVLFSPSSDVRGWFFTVRHQKTVADFAKRHNNDAILFGRRKQENTVNSPLYYVKGGKFWSCHPVREWLHGDIWEYLKDRDVPEPWMYSTPFKRNAPYVSARPKDVDYWMESRGAQSSDDYRSKAWDLVISMDPKLKEMRELFNAS